jgi:lactoylglutathione lyase
MKIEHVALWTSDLDRSLQFYISFFGAEPGAKYVNSAKPFESYFLRFHDGARLELMWKPKLRERTMDSESRGWVHVAFEVGSVGAVDAISNRLRSAGYLREEPRWTGDGYYEAVALDPDGNRIEIAASDRRQP